MDDDTTDDLTTILAEIDRMEDSIRAGFERLRGLVKPHRQNLDPSDPRNKLPNGKLSERGVEVCYRLFDEGKTPYTVGLAMDIAFGSAMHRFKNWEKLGGVNRMKSKLD